MGYTETKSRNHVKAEAEFQVTLTQAKELQETPEARDARKDSTLRTPEAVRNYRYIGVSLLVATTKTEKKKNVVILNHQFCDHLSYWP